MGEAKSYYRRGYSAYFRDNHFLFFCVFLCVCGYIAHGCFKNIDTEDWIIPDFKLTNMSDMTYAQSCVMKDLLSVFEQIQYQSKVDAIGFDYLLLAPKTFSSDNIVWKNQNWWWKYTHKKNVRMYTVWCMLFIWNVAQHTSTSQPHTKDLFSFSFLFFWK